MTTTPSREDWEIEFDTFREHFKSAAGFKWTKLFIMELLQSHNNALVAEIEELKEQRNEIYKMTVEHFSNEQEKVSFFKKFVDIISIIQEK